MSYSIDLRERVVNFVKSGNSKASASRQFSVSIWCVFDWLKRDDLSPRPAVRRQGKLDWEALRLDVEQNPDSMLRERAIKFSVRISAIYYALKKMQLTHKKRL